MADKENILVTGASSGIGLGISKRLVEMQYRVTGIARDFSKTGFNHKLFNETVIDLADSSKLSQAVDSLLQQNPEPDGLVLAAGQGHFGSLEEFSDARIQELMQINFTSQVLLTKAVLPIFKRKSKGRIIIIGSESALKGSRYGSIYCASKFALRGFAQALRQECTQHDISVSLVNPGMVNTPFFDKLNFSHGDEPGMYITTEQVADAVVYALTASSEINIDEINLSPRRNVVKKK